MKLGSVFILVVNIALSSVGHASATTSAQLLVGTHSKGVSTSIKQVNENYKVNSRAQAIQLVKRQYPGKVLNAKSARMQGRSGYRVKMLSKKGVVFSVYIDAKTAKINRY